MFVRVGVGDAYVMVGSEGVSYSPDLAHDMAARAYQTFRATLESAMETGYIDTSRDWDPDYPSVIDDDDDEDDDFDDDELDDDDEDDDEFEEGFLDGRSNWWIQ